MSFQFAATASKHSEVRKALEAARDRQAQDLPDGFDDSDLGREQARLVDRDRDELGGTLAEAGVAGAEAAARKLKDYGTLQVTVSGSDTGGQGSVAISINAIP